MTDTTQYKERLLQEKQAILTELNDVAQQDQVTHDWQAKEEETHNNTADPNEVADDIEELNSRTAVTEDLEVRLHEIETALDRIEKGTYGICVVCGKEIEQERLHANPAATTCIRDREE